MARPPDGPCYSRGDASEGEARCRRPRGVSRARPRRRQEGRPKGRQGALGRRVGRCTPCPCATGRRRALVEEEEVAVAWAHGLPRTEQGEMSARPAVDFRLGGIHLSL